MALDVFFRSEIRNILASTYVTMMNQAAETSPNNGDAAAYQRGFASALGAVAVAFGMIPPAEMFPPRPRTEIGGRRET